MKEDIKIFHNPHCSKSRQTLELLQANSTQPEIVEYLKNPPGIAELKQILEFLGLEPRQLMRSKEAEYQENNLDDQSLSRDQLLQAMVDHPILIERPIVIRGKRAVIGRPPEKVLEIL
jgi:arsenate reductase